MTPGAIVLVKFPFTHLLSTKKRPALVLVHTHHSAKVELVTVAMITSKVDGIKLPGDIMIDDWEKSHLLHPSLVRLAKVATLETSLIEKELGILSADDKASVRTMFKTLYKSWL